MTDGGLVPWLDRLAYPSGVLVIALLLLFLARRVKYLGQTRVGIVGLMVGAVLLLLSLLSPILRQLLFDASRLPVTLGLLLTPCVAWFTERAEGPGELPPRGGSERFPAFGAGEGWVAAAVLGVVFVLAWCLEPPLGPSASGVPLEPSHLPWFLSGWQEMRLVTRPLWNWLLWPLWIIALLAVPYLEPEVADDDAATSRREATGLFLFFVVVLGWVPLAVGSFLRDGQWRLLGLFGPRDSTPVEAVSMAESFWRRGLGVAPPELGLWRELPGCLAIVAYLALLCLVLPRWRASRGLFRRYRKQLGVTRYRLALALLTMLGWVPLKLLLYWLLAIDDWVVLPFWPGGL